MKTTPIFKILSAAVLLAVVFYFAVQGYHYFSDPINTTFVYASHEWEAIETEGYLVREEETFHSDMTTLHHALREGEKVGKNQTLAIAFPDSGALNRVERLEALEMQAQQLSFALESFLDGDAALKLDDNIREDLAGLLMCALLKLLTWGIELACCSHLVSTWENCKLHFLQRGI